MIKKIFCNMRKNYRNFSSILKLTLFFEATLMISLLIVIGFVTKRFSLVLREKEIELGEKRLENLADQWSVNAAYLGRLFKKETGISFVDYLNWYRIEKAESLLRETNIKGSKLCERVGFSSYNYFYVVFKKLKGMKPTDIREDALG